MYLKTILDREINLGNIFKDFSTMSKFYLINLNISSIMSNNEFGTYVLSKSEMYYADCVDDDNDDKKEEEKILKIDSPFIFVIFDEELHAITKMGVFTGK